MAYSERHKWCTGKIVEAFSPELTQEAAQEFFRQNNIIQQFNIFFKGDSSGRLFINYQPISQNKDVSIIFILFNYFTNQSINFIYQKYYII